MRKRVCYSIINDQSTIFRNINDDDKIIKDKWLHVKHAVLIGKTKNQKRQLSSVL